MSPYSKLKLLNYSTLFKEAFQTKDLEKAIATITKVLDKRIGPVVMINPKPIMFKKPSGLFLGYMYAIKGGPDRLRFNWRVGTDSSVIEGIDFYNDVEIEPSRSVATGDLNIVQIIDIITSIYRKNIPAGGEVFVRDELHENDASFKITKQLATRFPHKTSVPFFLSKEGTEIPAVATNDPFILNLYDEYITWAEKNKISKYLNSYNRFINDLKSWGVPLQRKVSVVKAEREVRVDNPEQDFMNKLFKELNLEPLDEDEIFKQIEYKIGLVLSRKLAGAIIVGTPGVGKSYTVQEMISKKGLTEYKDYILLKGKMSSVGLYLNLWEYRDKLIVIDDCDQPLKDDDGTNILKGATDTKAKRIVGINSKNYKLNAQILAKAVAEEGYDYEELVMKNEWKLINSIALSQEDPIGPPANFVFDGQIIAISNLFEKDIDTALTDRGGFIEVKLTPYQICNRIEKALPAISKESEISVEDLQGTLVWIRGVIDKAPYAMTKLSFRKFTTAAGYYASKINKWQQMALKEIAKDPVLKGR